MAENKELSHAEIWDDSSLINAWDTALQEYKKYHSIQAAGGNAELMLAEKEAVEEVEMKDVPPQQLDVNIEDQEKSIAPTATEEEEMEEGEVAPEASQEPKPQQPGIEKPEQIDGHSPQLQGTTIASGELGPTAYKPPNPPPFPPSILAGENEALRNLMISWYFAGYYTGLYEGQQQKGV